MSFFRTKSLCNYKQLLSALSLQTHFIKKNPKYMISPKIKKCFQKFLKRMSSGSFVKLKGSITVESAFSIPIFLFCVAALLSLFDIFRFQINMDYAVASTAKKLSVEIAQAEVYSSKAGETIKKADIVSELYALGKINAVLPDQYIKNAPLKYPVVSLLKSKIGEDDLVILEADYTVSPYFSLSSKTGFKTGTKAAVHIFNGYNVSKSKSANEKEIYVYITPTGTVYHKSKQCNYLDLSIQSVDVSKLQTVRNKEGSKYYACPYCKNITSNGNYYITDYGTSYHTNRLCSRLKRTIEMVPISEVGGRKPCSKCAGE